MSDRLPRRFALPVVALLLLGMTAALSNMSLHAQGAADFAPGPGVETVRAKCSACHPAAMITTRRFPAAQWANVVDQMIAKGAQVSDADDNIIVAYLATNYGPGK